MNVRNLSGKTALVTGAASGIGQACALAFAERGADLVLCDLDEAGLEVTAKQARTLGRSVRTRRVDVAEAAEVAALADEVHAELPAVDLLMNNAGVGLGASFADTSLEDWNWILGINLRGVLHGCHYFLPRMLEHGRGGHVVNTASMAGFTPTSLMPAYCTTKSAVLGFSESLVLELQPQGIGVTCLCPGIIDTPIVTSSPMRGTLDRPELRQRMGQQYRKRGYGPERVARNLLRAIQRDRVVAPVSPEAWGLYYLKRLAPGLVRAASRRLARREVGALSGGSD